MKAKLFSLLFILLLFTGIKNSISAQGFNISINIKGLKNKNIVLAGYYGSNTFAIDTALLNNEGSGIFTGKVKLTPGMYTLVFPNSKYYDILINTEQNFSIKADTTDFINSIFIENAQESQNYCAYQKKAKMLQNKSEANYKQFYFFKTDSLATYLLKMDTVKNSMQELAINTINDNKGSLLALYIKMLLENNYPDKTKVNKDSLTAKEIAKRYNYKLEHYFDSTDLTDERIIRSPMFNDKLDTYFKKLIPKNNDSICAQIELVLKKSKSNEKVSRFILSYLLILYPGEAHSKNETVYVYLVDKYFPIKDNNSSFNNLLNERAKQIKQTLIGVKAPDLKLKTAENQPFSLYKMPAEYSILFIYEPSCDKCVKELNRFQELFKDYGALKIKVFAIYTHADRKRWLDFVDDQKIKWINLYDPANESNIIRSYNLTRTPMFFLLDKDKKIIAKTDNATQLNVALKKLK